MSLLDRYLAAVRAHLPAAQQDDIIAELGEDLRARWDERAETLGRPLTEDEEAELLRPCGRPLLMAARYRPQQHLIGPHLFPYYRAALKVALSIALVVSAALLIALAVSGRAVGGHLDALWKMPVNAALWVFTWVTLVFAIIEVAAGRVRGWERWDPRSLPHETVAVARPSRFETGLELVLSTAFVAWWAGLPYLSFLKPLSNVGIGPAPAWSAFYLPILIVAIAGAAVRAFVLLRPEARTFRFVAGLVITAASLVILILLLRAGDLVVVDVPDPQAEVLASVVNMGLRVSFVVAIVVNAVTTATDARRYVRARAQVG
jgi:hypothetical protein